MYFEQNDLSDTKRQEKNVEENQVIKIQLVLTLTTTSLKSIIQINHFHLFTEYFFKML